MAHPGEAVRGADIIHRCFDDYQTRFRAVTRHTRERFERCEWEGIRRDTVKRLGLHAQFIDESFESLEDQLGRLIPEMEFWALMKEAYAKAILGRDDFELAQTFFNSLSRRVFPHVGVDPTIDFVSSDFPLPYKGWEMSSARLYAVRRVDAGVMQRVLEDAEFRVPFRDIQAAAERAAGLVEQRVRDKFDSVEIEALDVLCPVFIRNKAAYIIGRARRGESLIPIVLAILNREGELILDAVLTGEEETSVVFSFARWYFHADIASPREVIGFLHSVLPRKRIAELYVSLGYHKHGKTEFYRDLMRFVAQAGEQFIIAPGQPGLVMSVFTLPSFPFVFKVIRDCFPPSKNTTRDEVMHKYREVLRHDRVGRLVDFQEFEHLTFPRERFSEDLLHELSGSAARTVSIDEDEVVIRHLFIGRRVTPLDLYIHQAEPAEVEAAVVDWGFTLKDLAAANIFAGDMLLKNFGVTRHGRVVFYDYDEIAPLGDCRFREFPRPRNPEDEMAAEPWFSVSDDDVFPEELATFLELGGELRRVFEEHHGDLFATSFWRGLQDRNAQGEIIDFYPYSSEQRLRVADHSV